MTPSQIKKLDKQIAKNLTNFIELALENRQIIKDNFDMFTETSLAMDELEKLIKEAL